MLRTLLLDPEGRLRTLWRLSLFCVGFVLTVGMVLALLFAAAAAWPAVTGEPFPRAWLQENALAGHFLTILLLTPLHLGLVFLCRRFLDRRSFLGIGLRRPAGTVWASPWTGLALGVAAIAVPAGALWLGGVYTLGAAGAGPAAVGVLAVFLLAGFEEELVFRGYLYRNFQEIGRPWSGLLITAGLFWIVHGLNPHVWSSPWPALNLAAAGVMLALAYRTAGNLWFPTGLHVGWNAAQGVLLGLPVSGMSVPALLDLQPAAGAPGWLSGQNFGLEGSAAGLAANGALIALFLALGRRGIDNAPAAP